MDAIAEGKTTKSPGIRVKRPFSAGFRWRAESKTVHEKPVAKRPRAVRIRCMKTIRVPAPEFARFIRREMRRHGVTIRAFARFSGVSMARIRELRNTGRAEFPGEWTLNLRDLREAAR